jgi:hypothetical protein
MQSRADIQLDTYKKVLREILAQFDENYPSQQFKELTVDEKRALRNLLNLLNQPNLRLGHFVKKVREYIDPITPGFFTLNPTSFQNCALDIIKRRICTHESAVALENQAIAERHNQPAPAAQPSGANTDSTVADQLAQMRQEIASVRASQADSLIALQEREEAVRARESQLVVREQEWQLDADFRERALQTMQRLEEVKEQNKQLAVAQRTLSEELAKATTTNALLERKLKAAERRAMEEVRETQPLPTSMMTELEKIPALTDIRRGAIKKLKELIDSFPSPLPSKEFEPILSDLKQYLRDITLAFNVPFATLHQSFLTKANAWNPKFGAPIISVVMEFPTLYNDNQAMILAFASKTPKTNSKTQTPPSEEEVCIYTYRLLHKAIQRWPDFFEFSSKLAAGLIEDPVSTYKDVATRIATIDSDVPATPSTPATSFLSRLSVF